MGMPVNTPRTWLFGVFELDRRICFLPFSRARPETRGPHRFRRMGVRSHSSGMVWSADTTTSMCSLWGATRRCNSHTTRAATVFPAPRSGRPMGGRSPSPAAIASATGSTSFPY
jgi:hypothetical protein